MQHRHQGSTKTEQHYPSLTCIVAASGHGIDFSRAPEVLATQNCVDNSIAGQSENSSSHVCTFVVILKRT